MMEVLDMPDKISKKQRSLNMSKIKSNDNTIELKVRKYLYHHGFRYKKNDKSLPGKPDIVLNKYHTVIFINGCFWHQHYNCKYVKIPKSRLDYWIPKLKKNVQNDLINYKKLRELDYKVLIVWECEVKDCFEYRMEELIKEIKSDDEYGGY